MTEEFEGVTAQLELEREQTNERMSVHRIELTDARTEAQKAHQDLQKAKLATAHEATSTRRDFMAFCCLSFLSALLFSLVLQ